MKTKHSIQSVLCIALFSVNFLVLQSFYDGGKKLKNMEEIISQVNYVGVNEDYYLFKVSFEKLNLNRKKVEIKILTNDNEEIFTEQYSIDHLLTIFKINKMEIEKINFQILINGKINNHRFNVKSSYQEITHVVPVP